MFRFFDIDNVDPVIVRIVSVQSSVLTLLDVGCSLCSKNRFRMNYKSIVGQGIYIYLELLNAFCYRFDAMLVNSAAVKHHFHVFCCCTNCIYSSRDKNCMALLDQPLAAAAAHLRSWFDLLPALIQIT